jgi:hypothetical protein
MTERPNSEFVGELLPCLATSQEIDDLADLIVSQCSPTVFHAARPEPQPLVLRTLYREFAHGTVRHDGMIGQGSTALVAKRKPPRLAELIGVTLPKKKRPRGA